MTTCSISILVRRQTRDLEKTLDMPTGQCQMSVQKFKQRELKKNDTLEYCIVAAIPTLTRIKRIDIFKRMH